MSALDDSGFVSPALCPLCNDWCVTVSLLDMSWPEAGALVEAAVVEHVDEHVDEHVAPGVRLDCGCVLVLDEARDLGRLTPCSTTHRDIARRRREPGSRIIVGQVR
jgi:hypothetical protein